MANKIKCFYYYKLVRLAGFEPEIYGLKGSNRATQGKPKTNEGFNHFIWLDPFFYFGLLRDIQGNEGIFLIITIKTSIDIQILEFSDVRLSKSYF